MTRRLDTFRQAKGGAYEAEAARCRPDRGDSGGDPDRERVRGGMVPQVAPLTARAAQEGKPGPLGWIARLPWQERARELGR